MGCPSGTIKDRSTCPRAVQIRCGIVVHMGVFLEEPLFVAFQGNLQATIAILGAAPPDKPIFGEPQNESPAKSAGCFYDGIPLQSNHSSCNAQSRTTLDGHVPVPWLLLVPTLRIASVKEFDLRSSSWLGFRPILKSDPTIRSTQKER